MWKHASYDAWSLENGTNSTTQLQKAEQNRFVKSYVIMGERRAHKRIQVRNVNMRHIKNQQVLLIHEKREWVQIDAVLRHAVRVTTR